MKLVPRRLPVIAAAALCVCLSASAAVAATHTVSATAVIPAVPGSTVTACVDSTCKSAGPVSSAVLHVVATATSNGVALPVITAITHPSACGAGKGAGLDVLVPAQTPTTITATLHAITPTGTPIDKTLTATIPALPGPTRHQAFGCAS